jgi:hypothetical protein
VGEHSDARPPAGHHAFTNWTGGSEQATEGNGSMKPIVVVGIVLIVLGLAALAYHGISYTTRERVVEIGPVQVTAEKEKFFQLPPIVGAAAVGAGLVLVVLGSRRS